jgi:transposase
MKYSGIDLHSNNCVVSITDEEDRVIVEKRLPNDLGKIMELLMPWREELVGVVVESTYNWYWLVDGLQEMGFKVYLANTAAIKPYNGLKHRGDNTDARFLSHLLRLGILPTGTILPPEDRALRDLARKRLQLVRSRTSHILAVENIFARQSGHGFTSTQVKRLTAEAVDQMGLFEEVAMAIKSNLAVISTLSGQIDLLEKRLQERLKERPDYRLLMTIPGIGTVLAMILLLEIGQITRFASAGQFASYARCVESRYVSNAKKKGEGNTKNGNKYLSWVFIEAAYAARRHYPEAKRFFDRKKAKRNHIVATKALAHKLARACFYMLKENQPFKMTRCFA